jgi:hypothetical protein
VSPVLHVSGIKFVTIQVYTAVIVVMVEALCTSETSISFYEITLHRIPEGCNRHSGHREKANLVRVYAFKFSDQELQMGSNFCSKIFIFI